MKTASAFIVELLALAALVGGCAARTPAGTSSASAFPAPASPDGASRPGSSSELASLAQEYWEKRLEADPLEATLVGDRRFDDRLPDPSPEDNRREIARLGSLGERARGVDASSLGGAELVTLASLKGEIENNLALRACGLTDWTVNPRDGPLVLLQTIAHVQLVTTPEQARALVSRWRKIPSYFDAHADNLRRALSDGRVAPRGGVERVVRQLDDLLSQPIESWALAEPARDPHPSFTETERRALRDDVLSEVAARIRPALARYRDVLKNQILPRARDDEHAGLMSVPGGVACYGRLIKVHTSLDLDADEIHRIGLEENARIRAEMTALGKRLFGTDNLSAIQVRLRRDPAVFFRTRGEVEAKAKEALARADAAMPRWFGHLPKTPCVVKPVEAYEEKDTTIAYYRQPASDGTRPGTYYINTYAPETRPRYDAEALAFHESIPGHHTQVALAQELTGLPEFRKHAGVTAFVEGWALYTERLAREMGLYTSELNLMGMLSFDAWRASRLVVDTGLHVKGWSRQRAIRYMLENTVLAENNVEVEVDRYIVGPGQALAYKLGQREILALRREAERRLGTAFDIRAFHDQLLGRGAVSLSVLRSELEKWLERGGRPAP